MTYEEIKELAVHRDVPPWVVKLVGDAVAKENEACAKIADKYHIPMCDTVADAIAGEIRSRGNQE